jgi:TetR/AcrR family fatty acid metabolism transcriptional regulator
MPRTTRAQSGRQDKKDRILRGARRAFARHGFHGTRVSDVAREAGVADGTIYLYFESKDDLLAEVFATAMARFTQVAQGRLWQDASPVHQLERLIELHLELLGEDRDLAVVFQVGLRHSVQFLTQLSRGTLRAYLETIAGIVERGQAEGCFVRDIAPREAAKMVFGVLDELATNWVLSDRNYRLASKAPQTRAFVLRALGAAPSPAPLAPGD